MVSQIGGADGGLGLGKRTEKSREEEALPRLAPCACVARGESPSCELLGCGLACALDLFFFFQLK
jgi:hypothetical protein